MKLLAALIFAVTTGACSAAQKTEAQDKPVAASSCPCSGSKLCVGPRGGRYCITSGGNKRYTK